MKKWFAVRRVMIILTAIVIVAGGWLWYAFHHPQGGSPSTPSAAISAKINCFQSPEYFVIDNNPGSPGLDIVAKHKTSADEAMPCVPPATVAPASSDVVVRNDLPEFILGLTEHFLIIDSGTAPPPRGLIVYDLDAQTSTYANTYSPPLAIATGTVTYWASTKQVVIKTNCPDLGQYTADGFGAVIESRVVLDLLTLSKKALGEYRCEPTQ